MVAKEAEEGKAPKTSSHSGYVVRIQSGDSHRSVVITVILTDQATRPLKKGC